MLNKSNIRFVVTHISSNGLRVMTRACQGRNTHSSKTSANKWLDNFLSNNDEDQLISVFGPNSLGSFEVTPVECWPVHNDPKKTVFGF